MSSCSSRQACSIEALKHSIRRVNQLGFFKPLEAEAIDVEKTPSRDDRVDVQFTVEEQNRNQISFGAGASQYEGFFGNASFTTSNFGGRGESFTVSLQKGSRASQYQLAFTEPYMFGRPISAGVNLFSRKIDYQIASATTDYSEVRNGFGVTAGFPVRRYTRAYVTYGYEVIHIAASDSLQDVLANEGSLNSLLLLDEGRHTESSITPTIVHNTVDNPLALAAECALRAATSTPAGSSGEPPISSSRASFFRTTGRVRFNVTLSVNSTATDEDLNLTFPIEITSVSVSVQQCSGGIVVPPSGDAIYATHDVVASTGNTVAAVNSSNTLTLDVWYDLPNNRSEACIDVSAGLKWDNEDDREVTATKVVRVRVS